MPLDLLDNCHIVPAFVPIADAFAGGITTEAVSLANYRRATLVVLTGAIEDAGISNLITLQACTTAAGGTTAAIGFAHRVQRYSTTVDTWSELTAVSSSGYNFASNNAVANAVWYATVTDAQVADGVADGKFVRAVIAETANKTITAAGVWILTEPRESNVVPVSAIA